MPIVRNSFIQMSKLPNLKGRLSYISSKARQENLYAVYETTDRKFWTELVKCNQDDFKKSGTKGRCMEGRELIIALPECFVDYEPDRVLKLFTEHFKQKYGVECISALHHNKRKTNYHIHLIFSERKLLDEPVEKIATRNMFYDENGKHVRTKKEILDAFAAEVLSKHNKIDIIINNALPLMKGIDECSYEEFQYALSVGVAAPFYLVKLFMHHLVQGASIVNIASSRDRMSQPQTESYTAAKGGIAALTHALAVSLAGRARVNSISPGWIDTASTVYEGADASQHPAGRVGNPMYIANMVLFLCSDKAGFITGENICIDGGMTKQMIYHGDCGWKLDDI